MSYVIDLLREKRNALTEEVSFYQEISRMHADHGSARLAQMRDERAAKDRQWITELDAALKTLGAAK